MTYGDLSRPELEEALQELEERVSRLEDERDEWERRAKKIKADFENYKKDQDDRKQRWQHEARKDLAEDLIAVMDNLERAIMSADEDSGLLQGVKLVADQLYETLEQCGLERIDAEGEEFDPRLHNAVDTRHHPEHNKVLEQQRAGYMYRDQVLREAEVVVGQNEDNDT
ncbi:MAG: nucleotide exchange factor GrpE [Candidatus Nanohaloarchaea archaeon]|nr:nucleotide exchange factor GrpE [Candidatus Nanohaloarchaea archaeon]